MVLAQHCPVRAQTRCLAQPASVQARGRVVLCAGQPGRNRTDPVPEQLRPIRTGERGGEICQSGPGSSELEGGVCGAGEVVCLER